MSMNNKLSRLAFRLKFRKEIQKADMEMLQIIKEELNRDLQRRNKK